jgi:hypothetical protein
MSFKSKNFTLYLIVILVALCVLLAVEPCVAPEPTKPDKPIFAIEYPEAIDFTSEGLNLNITNQPFTPYTDDGSEINLYYEAQVKIPGRAEWWPAVNIIVPYVMQTYSQQYTMIPLPPQPNMDIRVRALVGTVIHHPSTADAPAPVPIEFKGVEGDWSDIQIVTINQPTSSPASSLPSSTSPANTNPLMPSTLEPDFDDKAVWSIAGVMLLAVVVLVVGVVLVIIAVVLLLRRGTKT